jgi:hypothetical protein
VDRLGLPATAHPVRLQVERPRDGALWTLH